MSIVHTTARRQFFEEGICPVDLPPQIVESWLRCQQQGSAVGAIERLGKAALQGALAENAQMLRVALPELDGLYEQVLGTQSVVLLTDASGLILNTTGNPQFMKKAEQVALLPGVSWDEATKGTNAIGTALALRESVEVRGGEHFLMQNIGISCSAAPIFAPNGRLAGVLNVSGDARLHHLHALGLVRLAAQQIEHRWLGLAGDAHWLMRLHPRAELLGSPREGVLSFAGDMLIAANRVALQWLGLSWQNLGQCSFSDLFDGILQAQPLPQAIYSQRGQRFYLTITPPKVALATPPAASSVAANKSELPFQKQLDKAVRVLNAGVAVLLQGETGSGKEVFARALHAASQRRKGAFVAINCAALPESLIEAELFGYEEGAFTGAKRKGSMGKLREANGGVLLLDEIGDMPLLMQARLLRVLQEREVTPLGGSQPYRVDFAVVCASHRDLPKMVAAGEFRADLFYRLQDFIVHLPPLREYADLLGFIARLWQESGGSARGVLLGDDLMASLVRYPWPGNVRQLLSLLKTLLALADDGACLTYADLPEEYQMPVLSEASSLASSSHELIENTIARFEGNLSKAAAALGVARSTLYRRRFKAG
ncbi:sigma-54-dependent Fis family transcriptional regulator [Iodobacter fluviatilis]|uniref:Acetoin catabolism regulatory protein n=1 Tax=Iodobacter fluviatilis TaxID=537 RepID=A0A377Q2K5_9NEIS|nr:sigma-54-dependent Fis family transcriptional regulator [Iodobacter fluviatilis]TCU90015.1 transcriptional regulator of acetoin/glycerol metabolism [Iodobacter fluviatilis]STQ89042.1 Acetoin catabolism regulatory protein [Iodobacter fluviatilis]